MLSTLIDAYTHYLTYVLIGGMFAGAVAAAVPAVLIAGTRGK